jgi:hypothetical protein
MPDEPVELAKINIIYRRDPDALEMMTLSDGANEVVLYLSPLGGMNMLLEVIDALLKLIPYGLLSARSIGRFIEFLVAWPKECEHLVVDGL